MQDLFGQNLPQQRHQKPRNNKAELTKKPAEPLPILGPRVPTTTVVAIWKEYNFFPTVNLVVHFNIGRGYDLNRKKKSLFSKCFGHILEVNEITNEVLIHLPKSINSNLGDEDYYICAFYDLMPIEAVKEFDVNFFIINRPAIQYTDSFDWNITKTR